MNKRKQDAEDEVVRWSVEPGVIGLAEVISLVARKGRVVPMDPKVLAVLADPTERVRALEEERQAEAVGQIAENVKLEDACARRYLQSLVNDELVILPREELDRVWSAFAGATFPCVFTTTRQDSDEA